MATGLASSGMPSSCASSAGSKIDTQPMPSRFGKPEHVYRHGSLQASFLHFYFASNPQAAASLFLADSHKT